MDDEEAREEVRLQRNRGDVREALFILTVALSSWGVGVVCAMLWWTRTAAKIVRDDGCAAALKYVVGQWEPLRGKTFVFTKTGDVVETGNRYTEQA